jgi:3-dehydroquinate synthase class II
VENTPSVQIPVSVKQDRQWWFDARGMKPDNAPVWAAVERSGCGAVLIDWNQIDVPPPGKQRVVWVEQAEHLDRLALGDWVLSPDESVAQQARRSGRKAGCFVELPDEELRAFPRCLELTERGHDFLVLDMHHATYIPFEQLVVRVKDAARKRGHSTQLFRRVPIKKLQETVSDINQSLNAFATLEIGVDVLLGVQDQAAIEALEQQIAICRPGQLALTEAEVIEIQHTLMGDRVCIDTTSLLTKEEGMILGATGWGGVFVCSETHPLPYMNFREFRVNAGSVHCYVWGPEGKAVYLSELRAGSAVLAVDVHGNTRAVTVGRVKIERRPLLLITALTHWTYPGEKEPREVVIKTFVQNDWHVRVMGVKDANRQVFNSSLIKVGDKLLVHPDWPGRHLGEKIDETILEK